MKQDYYIEKTVSVSDPEQWYGSILIKVKMYHTYWPECKNNVRIMFDSIDDFKVYRDFHEWDLQRNWEWCKRYLFDMIPNRINTEWMYEHGYTPY